MNLVLVILLMLAPIREKASGKVDGVNTLFLLSKVPAGGSPVLVFLNGLLQQPCTQLPCDGDYQQTDVRSIRFLLPSQTSDGGGTVPQVGSKVTFVYWVP